MNIRNANALAHEVSTTLRSSSGPGSTPGVTPCVYRVALAILALATLMMGAPLQAHHSTAVYDFKHLVTIKGVIKTFDVKNPHTTAIITVSKPGGPEDVQLQSKSYSNFLRAGWQPTFLKAGDVVTLEVAPRVLGKGPGYIMKVTTASGQTVSFDTGTD